MMYARKQDPYIEQRLRERERVESALSLREKFPKLKSLSVVLEYFDQQRMTPAGELRYKANVQHAKSVLTFSCPNSSCKGGGFDLSDILQKAVAAKSKTAQGELPCMGIRSVVAKQQSNCRHLLHYKLIMSYV